MSNLLEAYANRPIINTPQPVVTNENDKNIKTNKKAVKAASIAGSLAGIGTAVAGIYALKKGANPNLLLKNLRYEEADVLMIGAGSVLGGLAGGLIADKNKDNAKPKLREASQQFFGNMVCPISLLAIGNKLLDKANIKLPQIKSTNMFAKAANHAIPFLPKVAMTIAALIGGMEIGNKIMNTVNNKVFKEDVKHDVHAEDYLVHADDLCLAANLILKDAEAISNVTSKVLPLTFVVAGSKTGMQEA